MDLRIRSYESKSGRLEYKKQDENKYRGKASKQVQQIAGLRSLEGLSILELGSGTGHLLHELVQRGALAFGVEPDVDLFNQSVVFLESQKGRAEVYNKTAEDTGLESELFDIVCSFQVIEHVQQPAKVFTEAHRVLKKKGEIFFVYPNYRSFYEGHYSIIWLPFLYISPALAKLYARLWSKDPDFIDTINMITPSRTRKYATEAGFRVLDLGKGYMMEITRNSDFPVKNRYIHSILKVAQRLRILSLVVFLLASVGMHYPIMLRAVKE